MARALLGGQGRQGGRQGAEKQGAPWDTPQNIALVQNSRYTSVETGCP